MNKLDSVKFGYAGAITAAIGMLALGLAGNAGIYRGAVGMMMQWHTYFSLTGGGIITGMIEAAIITFVFAYIFASIYNKLLTK